MKKNILNVTPSDANKRRADGVTANEENYPKNIALSDAPERRTDGVTMKTYAIYILILALTALIQVPAEAQQIEEGNAGINSLMKMLPGHNDDTLKVKLLNDISYRFNKVSPYDGIKYGIQSLTLAEELHWKPGIARANSAIGANYFSLSDFRDAYKYWLKALAINEELGNNAGIARHLHNIGDIYASQRSYTTALEYYNKALQLNEKTGNQKLATNSYTAIGNVYAQLKDYPKAIEYHFHALALDEELGIKGDIAADQINIGSVYDAQGNYSKAMEILFQALRIKKELGEQNGAAKAYNMIGKVFMDIARQTSEDKAGVPGSRKDNLQHAIAYLDSAIMTDEKIGYLDNMQKSYECLSDVMGMLNDPKQELEDYKKYVVIKDSIFSLEKHTDIFNLEKKAEIEENERTMEKANEAKERKEYLQICGISAFIVIFISVILLLRHKSVNPKIIELLGTLSILIIFEFAQLLLHGQIEKFTHQNLTLTLVCLLVLASVIIPFHHKIEHWMKAKIGRK